MDPLKIGHVIGVHGDQVDVQISVPDLRLEYHGTQYRVGRLGTYVTIPMGRAMLIGYVTRIGAHGELEPGPNPEAPRRITMGVELLGTVRNERFSRGVNEYPTLGDTVRLGVDEDFELIFGSFEALASGVGYRRAFPLGRFAMDTDFEVKVLGNEFFAKHVAVMGNSGSGKSVTTAKIIHEALRLPHTQVVMFDMHGEYSAAFSAADGEPDANVTYLSDRSLVLPYWMLQYGEFEQLFLDSNNPLNINAQKVFLRSAFEKLKHAAAVELGLTAEYTIDTPLYYSIESLKTYAENMNDARFVLGSQSYAFARLPHRTLPPDEQECMLLTRRMEFNKGNPEGEVPHATYHGRLLGLVNQIESRLNDRRYDFLLRPFEQASRNAGLATRLRPDATPGQLSQAVGWVIRQLCGRLDGRKNLTIVDLSGLPFDVVDMTVASLTRALFDFNFWSPPDSRQPILLVYEEAHNYLPRRETGRRMFARDAVEKVAKEGRKYGVSAMIVTQRPSEISETVLSQCNSMVLMRMNNPDDQNFAARVVSDQFKSLIGLLSSMRPGEAFIIGDGVLMPMRTLIDLPPKLPRSSNVDFFKLWAQGVGDSDVETIVDRWWRQDRKAHNAHKSDPAVSAPTDDSLGETAPLQAAPGPDAPPPPVEPDAADDAPAVGAGWAATTDPGAGIGGGTFVSEPPQASVVEPPRSVAQQKLAELAALFGVQSKDQ